MDSGFQRPTGIGWFSTSGYEIDSICLFSPLAGSPSRSQNCIKEKQIVALFGKKNSMFTGMVVFCFCFGRISSFHFWHVLSSRSIGFGFKHRKVRH